MPAGYHVHSATFTYYSTWIVITTIKYDPGTVTITSGGGDYNSDTWTTSITPTSSVTMQMAGQNRRNVAIKSISVIIEQD